MFGKRRQEPQEERQTFGRAGSANRYQMHQRMISIGDDYWIENEAGAQVFHINGKALRVQKTLIFEDAQGNELVKIQERMLHIRSTMTIEGPHGEQLAVVKKALITPLRERFTVNLKNGPDLEVHGNILDHEYTISEGHNKVAEVSKKWFRLRDSYGVEIASGQDEIIILAVTIVIDQLAHKGR